jgi:hypothetical protein
MPGVATLGLSTLFVTLGWGIGLLAHGWTVYGQNEDRREAQIRAEMDKLRNRP